MNKGQLAKGIVAKKGIVVVTVNYRLGIFGFFAHPELSAEASYKGSGNYDYLVELPGSHQMIAN
jgi:carboxylesterase type B